MATSEIQQSDVHSTAPAGTVGHGPSQVARPPGKFWLDGEVVACACPDCGGPMSIRMWLKLADCIRCATAIELSEELVEQIERLQREKARQREGERERERERQADQETRRAAADGKTSDGGPPSRTQSDPPSPQPSPRRSEPTTERVAAASVPIGVRRRIHTMATVGTARVWWREAFRDAPAWIVSGVLHLAALLILAMLAFGLSEAEDPYITLSTEIDPNVRTGGQIDSSVDDEVDFDLPLDPNDLPETHEARVRLDQDTRELRLDRDTVLPNARPIEAVKAAIKSADPDRRALAVRDPRVRAEVVRQEGGTTLTEAAVTRGLRWMALHQNAEGSWSLERFHQTGECGGRCSGHGNLRSDAAGTSLVLLPFLGAGQTHLVGNYQSQVASGLRYLIGIQKEDGDLRGNSSGNSGMYAHGQASLVLCEAYKMTGDEMLRKPAQRAVDFIVKAQHLGGGWRYKPHYEPGAAAPDTSVLGWQVLALYSAKAAYLDVPDSTLQLASQYLDSAKAELQVETGGHPRLFGRKGGVYGYQPGNPFKPAMTAEGLLCRMMMGWKLDHPGLQEGVGVLIEHHLPSAQDKDLYYWYYGTQMMHHVGGRSWRKWNLRMRDVLVQLQEKNGHQAGSWPPGIDHHGSAGGRLYTTAFATAILEVYYRHAPLFRQIEL